LPGHYYRFAQEADAFSLHGGRKARRQTGSPGRCLPFSRNIVGKQIDDPVLRRQALFIVMDDEDTAWDTAMDVLLTTCTRAVLPATSQACLQARDMLEGAKENSAARLYRRLHAALHPRLRQPRAASASRDRSAEGSFLGDYLLLGDLDQRELPGSRMTSPYDLASEGFAIKNGGGTDGLMIETRRAFMISRMVEGKPRWRGDDPQPYLQRPVRGHLQVRRPVRFQRLCLRGTPISSSAWPT